MSASAPDPFAQHLLAQRRAVCERGDLAGYAAYAALVELHGNWVAALADGAKLPELVKDIDEVKLRLDEHRAALIAATGGHTS